MRLTKEQSVKIEIARAELEKALDALTAAVQEVGADLRSAFDDKSEKWQDSDAGADADLWIQTYEDFRVDADSVEGLGDLTDAVTS